MNVKPDWNTWFMSIAFLVSQRSIDPHTKHGCVVTDKEYTILSLGYNSPPRNCFDNQIPLTRPEKYKYFEHSESNAINNAARIGIQLKNSVFYISGYPCCDCVRRIINVGAKRIIYGPVQSKIVDKKACEASAQMLLGQGIQVEKFCGNIQNVINLLNQTSEYVISKNLAPNQ